MKVIEVKHLRYSYHGLENVTLNDISFDINEGEYISLVGPNGSGKSTLARVIAGLLEKNEGSVFLFDKELNKQNIYEIRKHLGMVFQNPDNQFIGATVEEDIAFGLENRQIKREEMAKIIHDFATKVGMIDYLKKEPTLLSGGQKQRVAIASVLALAPDILILDEATSMLDPKGRREIRELIEKIRKENPKLTVISITHDIEEAYQSDRIMLLSGGKLIKFDKPEEVFKNSEELKKAHLSVPLFFEIKEKLNKKGIDIEKDKTLKEARDYLCR